MSRERKPRDGASRAGRPLAGGIRRHDADDRRRDARCWRRLPSLFFGGTIVAIAGSVIVTWTVGDAYPSHHVMAILLGSLATSLVLFVGCMTTGTLAAKVFLVWSVSCCRRRLDASLGPELERRDGLDVLAIVAIAILVVAGATTLQRRCRPSRRPASFQSGRTTRFTAPKSRSSETRTC